MLKLRRDREAGWVELVAGAALLCDPPSTPVAYAARARADALIAELREAGEVVTKAGGRIVGGPDLDTPEGLAGARQSLFVVSLAEIVVRDWRGIGDADGEILGFDAGHIAMLMSDPIVADAFQSRFLLPVHEVVREGNV